MDLKDFRLTTVIVVIALIVIGLYALTEVNYFSYKNVAEPADYNASVLSIPSIGVFERINNVSISQGVYIDASSNIPTQGDVVLFGHRTLQGSPFLRLNELKPGDVVTLQWPGIGEVNYHPVGSTAERMICIADLSSTGLINETALQENPQANFAWYIAIIFLAFGLLVSYFYSGANRMVILATVLIITAVLIYFCIFPMDSQVWADKLGVLNSWMGVTFFSLNFYF